MKGQFGNEGKMKVSGITGTVATDHVAVYAVTDFTIKEMSVSRKDYAQVFMC